MHLKSAQLHRVYEGERGAGTGWDIFINTTHLLTQTRNYKLRGNPHTAPITGSLVALAPSLTPTAMTAVD